jgi:hypothetical protein
MTVAATREAQIEEMGRDHQESARHRQRRLPRLASTGSDEEGGKEEERHARKCEARGATATVAAEAGDEGEAAGDNDEERERLVDAMIHEGGEVQEWQCPKQKGHEDTVYQAERGRANPDAVPQGNTVALLFS